MKKKWWIMLAVIILAAISKPDFEKHKEKIDQKFSQQNPVAGSIGAGKIYSNLVEYHNYYLFSATSSGNSTVSIGFFAVVLVIKDVDVLE